MKSRITRITAALLAAVLSLSLLAGCKPKKELTRYTTIFYDVFDTVTQVIAYCESEEEFNTQMQALHQDLIAYNQLYDIYNDYDGVVNVKTINENAGKAPVQVDDRILSMLELARQMYDLTGGKINIAMGSVLGIWHDYREAAEQNASETDNTLPTQEELEAAAQHCDINDLVIDEDAKTVYLSDPEMSLDVGSVGKGLRRGDGLPRCRSPRPDQRTGERRRQPARHRHKAGRQPVDGRCGEPVERLGGVYQHQLHLRLAHQHERPCAGDQRRLPALLCGGRQALPPHHRPGHPVARRLLQRRHRAVPGLRHGRLPDHCSVLYAAGRRTEAGGIAGRRRGHVVHA